MKPLIFVTAVLAALVPTLGTAQSTGPTPAQLRDSATAFIRTHRFIVGRLARDCLATTDSKETPRAMLDKWDSDNAKYVAAADKYMAARLQEVQEQDGPRAREEMDTVLYVTVERNGAKSVADILAKGEKATVCKEVMSRFDDGKMNLDAMSQEHKMPVFDGIADLVEWAKTH